MSPTTSEDCPICLEAMDESDVLFPLLCSCQYNMCRLCIVSVIESSQSGYSESSDGSMQLKTNQKCPQCRFDLRHTLRDTVILRQAHCAQNYSKVADSELNATHLRLKHEFLCQQDEVEKAAERYTKAQEEGTTPVSPSKKTAIVVPVASFSSESSVPPPVTKPVIDSTLFQGLEEFLNEAEQVYLSQLLTSGDVQQLVIAAHILHGVLDASISGQLHIAARPYVSATQERKRLEHQAKYLKRFPLPRRMPRFVSINLPIGPKDLQLRDEDDKETIQGDDKTKLTAQSQRKVIKINGMKAAVGRLGLRKGDIITHVNGEEYKGTAVDLQNFLQQSNEIPDVSVIVNADRFTATALQQRCEKARTERV